jgi:nicotinamidase-related amidase
MSDFSLDPKTTALVLIDLQKSNVERDTKPHAAADVVGHAMLLADAVRAGGGPVVFVRVLVGELPKVTADEPFPSNPKPPHDASDIDPEAGMQHTDILVTKRQWGAFYGTDLEQQLRRRAIRTIVLGGIATNFGVESTARDAFDRGFDIVFAEDATTSVDAAMHQFSIEKLFPRMGRVRSTEEIVEALRD